MVRFRKLYADVVTEDGAVAVVYLAWLDCVGLRAASAAVEWYAPDGRRSVWHALKAPPPVDPDAAAQGLTIELALAAGSFRLQYAGGWPAWAPAGAPADLAWRVLQPRAEARVTWTDARGPQLAYGTGYADWVDCRCAPRRLGLRSLGWGRGHWPGGAAVYTAVTLASGSRWVRAARWQDGALVERLDALELEHEAGGGLVARAGPEEWLRLAAGRTLHAGPGLDRDRFPRLLDRLGARLLSGPVDETRWTGAVLAPARGTGTSSAVHERVRFGA